MGSPEGQWKEMVLLELTEKELGPWEPQMERDPDADRKAVLKQGGRGKEIPQALSFLSPCSLWPVPPVGLLGKLNWGPASKKGWEMPLVAEGRARLRKDMGGKQRITRMNTYYTRGPGLGALGRLFCLLTRMLPRGRY